MSETEQFPLFLDVLPATFNVNYMRNVRSASWDIPSLPTPIYLFQPDVEPGPEGGRVKTQPPARKPPQKGEFVEAVKPRDPSQAHWIFAAADGRIFKGTPDTLSNYAILRRKDDAFHLQLVDHSIRFFEDRPSTGAKDGEAAIRKMKEQQRLQAKRIQAVVPSYAESVRQDAIDRHARAEEALELDHETRVDHSDVESDGAPDIDGQAQSDEGVDPAGAAESDAIEEVSDVDVSLFWPEEEGEGEEEDEEKEKPKRPKLVDTVAGAAPTNQAIVQQVFGPEVVAWEELFKFMREVGLCTGKDLKRRFCDRIKVPERLEAFKRLCVECLVPAVHDGRRYFKLKAT
jgi:hypothetical protein